MSPLSPALEVIGVSKHFDGVAALRDARLDIRPGEIHALLGENGAGKSTLIKVVTGVYTPDGGEIRRDGEVVSYGSVGAARRDGVVALYQELSVVPTLSVAENVLLGSSSPHAAGVVRWRELRQAALAQLRRLNQDVSLRRLAGTLSPVQQTMVAVARALAAEARVLILDEPTAALTDTEILDLFAVLRRLRDDGVAIVYVSHRLEEVFALCDRFTVMRGGSTVACKKVSDASIDDVISLMVGREPGELFPERDGRTGDDVLVAEGIQGRRIRDVSLRVAAGEVLGIGGLAGSGRSELLRILAGAQRRRAGRIAVQETELPAAPGVATALRAGIALVPEERRSQGVILSASIQDNVALANLDSVSRAGWVSEGAISALARTAVLDLQIKAQSRRQPVGQLSGGNQQKVVLAKMLARTPRVLLLDEPTRGIDVGTKAEIYRLIRRLAATGTAVVVVSSEIPELIGVADRILVMHEGCVSGQLDAASADEERVLSLCYGKAA